MNRNHVPYTLFDRELGQSFELSTESKRWSDLVILTQPAQTLQFSKIISMHYQQDYLAFVTKTGEGFLYNSFYPSIIQRLLDTSSLILNLTILDNKTIFLVVKPKQEQYMRFLILPVTIANSSPIPILETLQVTHDKIDQLDVYSHYLAFKCNQQLIVYDLENQNIIFQENGSFLYIRECVVYVSETQNRYELRIKNLKSGQNRLCVINDCSQLTILDLLNNFLIFTQKNRLYYIECSDSDLTEVSTVPKKYFVGRYASVSAFNTHMIIMNREKTVIDLVPKVFCADIVGILVLYEKLNSRIVVLKDNGEILQTLSISYKVLFISVNIETLELALALQDTVQIYQ